MRSKLASVTRAVVLAVSVVALLTAAVVAVQAATICETVSAGCDTCTVCNRFYLLGDLLCNESYYICHDTCTGALDGQVNDNCW